MTGDRNRQRQTETDRKTHRRDYLSDTDINCLYDFKKHDRRVTWLVERALRIQLLLLCEGFWIKTGSQRNTGITLLSLMNYDSSHVRRKD